MALAEGIDSITIEGAGKRATVDGKALHRFLALAPDAPYPAPQESLFGDEDFIDARNLADIGQRLIQDCEEFAHLCESTVTFLWKREGGEKQGQATLGMCVKPSGMVRHFSGAAWVIWVAADHCATYELTRHQIESLLHHELLHASVKFDKNGEPKPTVAGHDWDGFSANIKRYGLWQENLKLAARAFEQAKMFGD